MQTQIFSVYQLATKQKQPQKHKMKGKKQETNHCTKEYKCTYSQRDERESTSTKYKKKKR